MEKLSDIDFEMGSGELWGQRVVLSDEIKRVLSKFADDYEKGLIDCNTTTWIRYFLDLI